MILFITISALRIGIGGNLLVVLVELLSGSLDLSLQIMQETIRNVHNY